jgi:phosphohistidine phosphatase
MDIVLWRHAAAQDWLPGCDDMERMLTPRGRKQAARMAAWLDQHLPKETQILVSPARRAEQTVQALGRKYTVRPELAPNASASQLLELVQWPCAKRTVLVVGHQPTLGRVVAKLMGLQATDCTIKKGAVWWLRNREEDASAKTIVVTVQSPEFL